MGLVACVLASFGRAVLAQDLAEIKAAGVLRHLGVPYANFVTGSGDGLDVEVIQGFAATLGVRYEYVQTDWKSFIGGLTGQKVRRGPDGTASLLEATPILGDVAASGITVLPWRREVVEFSAPTFPSGVWLIARADAPLTPIQPTGSLETDIGLVKTAMQGHSVLALEDTCLDPALYNIAETGAEVRLPKEKLNLNEMAPAVLNLMAENTLLDVPDALIALEKWPGELKVIGPVSGKQTMAVAFRKSSPALRAAFETYLAAIKADGTYHRLVEKYYPSVFLYFSDFFTDP